MTQLSPHFSLAELTRSNTGARLGIDNTPSDAILSHLHRLADCMELVRETCGHRPITVFSGYRCPELNRAVGGSRTSSHKDGDACDFKVEGRTIGETISLLRHAPFKFDQLIDEFGSWVHIGFGPRYRRQILSARKEHGHTVYRGL